MVSLIQRRAIELAACMSVSVTFNGWKAPVSDFGQFILLNIYFITSVGVQVCDRRPSVRRVLWLTMHNKLSQD
jgi:hypothetical protein